MKTAINFYRKCERMDSFRPRFFVIIKETNSFVTLREVECDVVGINTIKSEHIPTEVFKEKSTDWCDATDIKISKKKFDYKFELLQSDKYVYDSGYALWTEEDKLKWEEYKIKTN